MVNIKISVYIVEKKAIKGKGEISYLFGRDKKRKKHMFTVHGHQPYFYVKNPYFPEDERIVSIEEYDKDGKEFQLHDGTRVYKIIVTNSVDVSGYGETVGVRDYFETDECCEDDIPYTTRVVLDIGLKNGAEIPDKRKIHYTAIKPCDFYIPLRRIHFDIETMTEVGNKIPDVSKARQPITVINCIDSYTKVSTSFVFKKGLVKDGYEKVLRTILKTPLGNKYKWIINAYNTEVEMLNSFLRYYKYTNGDVLFSWNGDQFDYPYLINRMKVLNSITLSKRTGETKIDYTSLSPMKVVYWNDLIKKYIIKGVIIIDSQLWYLNRQTKTVGKRLGDAGEKILGYGKIKLGVTFNEAYKKKLKHLLYYNAIDTIIDYEIYEKMRQEAYYSGLREMVGIDYEHITSNLRVLDHLFLSRVKEKGWISPSARSKLKEEFKGAHVEVPSEYGRIKNVCSFDFKSLYPGIIIIFNMGFDTYIGYDLSVKELEALPFEYISTPFNTYFRKDKVSVIVEVVIEFIDYRDSIKETLFKLERRKKDEREELTEIELKELEFEIQLIDDTQTIIKFLTNSIYGIIGNEHFRFFNIFIAGTITSVGRLCIILSRKIIMKYGWTVIYGDTDSIKIKLKALTIPKMIAESKKIEKLLNTFYKKYFPRKFNLPEDITIRYLNMRPETISPTYFMSRLKGSDIVGAKKKYSESIKVKFILGRTIILDIPEIEIKGYLRSNLSVIGNKVNKKVNYMIHEDKSNNKIRNSIIDYLKNTINEMRQNKFNIRDICLRTGASKKFSDYIRTTKTGQTVPMKVEHVDAGRFTNEWAHNWNGTSNLGKGSIIHYIFIKEGEVNSKYPRTNKIALDDNNFIPTEFIEIIDYDELIKKTLLSPLDPILKEMSITIQDILYGGYTEPLI
ncbi:hypothetical protein LCGC14_0945520 [marine sediment metagenome]|uniref:DNA-directed DNA polymerase n=1 Tax=marine sediment metagenome TaxID=412755 RepID=A0A0F9P4X1_9ZZZZ